MSPRTLFALMLALCTASLSLFAQTGVVTGDVVDLVTRERLPGANVVLLSTALGASTDETGRFTITNVPVGTYQIRATLVGYAPTLVSDIVVAVGKPTEILLRMDQQEIGLAAVEVRASYFQKTSDAPVSVQKLSYEEIRRSPGGFEDVVRAVSVLPGVAQAQPGRNDLVVRGGSPAENLFVVDNIVIPNINHFGTQGASGGPLSYINLDFVQETSFSTGGFGVRYGDKMSSLLDINLRPGRDDRVGGKATIAATQFGLNLEGPISSDATFLVSARRSYLDLIFKAAGFGFVPEYWDFLGRARWTPDGANTITFLGIGAIDDVRWFNGTADQRFDNSRVLGTAQKQYATGVTWQHLFGNGISTVTLQRTSVSYNGLQRDSLLIPIFSNASRETETGLRADMVMKFRGGTELSFGGEARWIGYTTSLAIPGFVSPFGDTIRVGIEGVEQKGVKGGAFVQVSQHLPLGFQLTVGGRMDYFDVIDRKFTGGARASLAYELTNLTTVSFTAGSYSQAPSYIWLVATPGNRSLTPARADHYILGVEHLLRADLRVRLEGYIKEYHDYPASLDQTYLVMSNTGGGYGGSDDDFASYGLGRLGNGGRGRSRGVELLVQKKLSEVPVYGIFSLTVCNTDFTALDGIERRGSFDQRVLISLSGGYRFDERWEASAKFRYSSGRPYTPFRPDGTRDVAQYNSATTQSLHGLDLRVDRRWNFASWSLIAYLDIQNVYNNKINGSVRWNARERRMQAEDSGIGILPSIGVSAEF